MTTFTNVVFRAVVPAKPDGLWTLVTHFIKAPLLLRFSAEPPACWSYADDPQARCGPDGDPKALLDARKCLVPGAPVGALIGKVGGSTAATDDGQTFVVGRYCFYRAEVDGPLYLTINDERVGMGNNGGSIAVTIVTFQETAPETTRA